MSETAIKPTTPQTPEEIAAANAAVAQKLKDQGGDLNKPGNPDDFKATEEGLDAIAAQLVKKKEEEAESDPDAVVTPKPEDKPVVDDEAAKKAADEAAAKEAEKKAAEERAEAFFKDSPKLPPNASPKSVEAFNSIKQRAAQDISARDAEIEKLKKDLAERDEKLKNPLTPEIEAEIKELREFRAKLDVETDPKFKEFDKNMDATREFIYDQLRKSPNVQGEKIIEQIKKYGGPEMIDWSKLWDGLKDPTMQRIIESSIAEIEKAKFLKSQAVQTAKKHVDEYVKERATQAEKAVKGHNEATKAQLAEFTSKLDFLKERTIDPKADEATKKQLEAENAWVKETNEQLLEAVKDDSPNMRALMIAGMAQLFHTRRVLEAERAVFQKEHKELLEARESLKKIKSASVNRIRENGAPADGKVAPAKKTEGDIFTKPGVQALDDLAKEIMEKRAAMA